MSETEKAYSAMAIARDPHTIFIYWDAEKVGADKLTGKPGSNIRAIAGWALDAHCPDTGDVLVCAIDPAAGRHYLHGLVPGQTYHVRLCMQDTMRDLHTLVRFPPVTTPCGSFCQEAHPDWPVSLDELRALLGPEGLNYLGASDLFHLND